MLNYVSSDEYYYSHNFPDARRGEMPAVDTSRLFIVHDVNSPVFDYGDILKMRYDDNTRCPKFERLSDGKEEYVNFYRLRYYREGIKQSSITTLMTNAKQFIKNLGLTKDQKMLREEGMKDEHGEYTSDYKEAVNMLICKEYEPRIIELLNQKRGEEKKEEK